MIIMKNKTIRKLLIGFLILVLSGAYSWAEKSSSKSLKSVDFLAGFSSGKLQVKGNYQSIPFIVDFNFDLKPLTSKIRFNPPSAVQFCIEPYISPVITPDSNVEIGNMFMLKLGLVPEGKLIQPYLKAGIGMLYMTQHTREQGSQFNFAESGGMGVNYFFKKNIALTLEGRFRHLSNSGIAKPNHGINSFFVLSGITYRF